MKKVAIFFLLFLFVQSAFPFVQPVLSPSEPQISKIDRVRLAEAFHLGEKLSDRVWKDWNKTPFAVLLITPEDEFLLRHPAPSDDFSEIGDDDLLKSKIYRRKRNYNPSFLATFPGIKGSGVSTIIVGQAENTFVKTSTPWVVTILHEHFHQMQDSQPGMYQALLDLGISGGDQTGMWMLNYPFPYTDKIIGRSFGELAKQLAKALETEEKTSFQNELENYLKMRADFNKLLKPEDYKYLSMQLWKEGIARYAEYEIAKLAAKNYQPTKEFRALKDFQPYAQVADELRKRIITNLKSSDLNQSQREVAYPFGAGEALLLDKAKVDWKSRYFSDKFYIDRYFAKE